MTHKSKKAIVVLLVALCLLCTAGCAGNNKEPSESTTSQSEEQNNATPSNLIEYYVDGEFKSKISFEIPESLKGKYSQKLSSSFSEGYCELTIGVKDTDYDIFTIYCSKDNKYEQFKDKKGYEVLGNDGTYTFIWYEHENENAEDANAKKVIEEFQSEYNSIKSYLKTEE